METMYDNTKKSRLTNTTKENNYYYEPIIKTARNDEVQILSRCTFDNENKFKDELISFLKDKRKEVENTQEIVVKENEIEFTGRKCKLDLLNEILDFVNKGGKK